MISIELRRWSGDGALFTRLDKYRVFFHIWENPSEYKGLNCCGAQGNNELLISTVLDLSVCGQLINWSKIHFFRLSLKEILISASQMKCSINT